MAWKILLPNQPFKQAGQQIFSVTIKKIEDV